MWDNQRCFGGRFYWILLFCQIIRTIGLRSASAGVFVHFIVVFICCRLSFVVAMFVYGIRVIDLFFFLI